VVKWVLVAALLGFLLVFPLYFDEFWLRTGFAVFGAAIGAIGLNLLVGTTGQLSLAHAFFLAVGRSATPTSRESPAGSAPGPHCRDWACRRSSAWSSASCSPGWPGSSSARSRRGCAASTSVSPRWDWSSSASTSSTPGRR
jgi:hypothetical protein